MGAQKIVVGITYPIEADTRAPSSLQEDMNRLESLSPDIEVVLAPYTVGDELGDQEAAVWGRLTVALVHEVPSDPPSLSPNLRWVHVVGSGVDHVEDQLAAMSGVVLTSSAGVNGVPVAEFAIARLLAHWKRFDEVATLQRRREWANRYGRRLQGSTVGTIGLGNVGEAICTRLRAFDVTIWGCREDPSRGGDLVDHIVGPERIGELFEACDAIIVAVPGTAATDHLLDEDAFAAMRPGAWVCNVSRGSVVDEEALVACLRSGHLSGAAIDVTKQEPLPADSALWKAESLALSAHCATSLDEHFEGVHTLFHENLARFLRGNDLVNHVDVQLGH